MTTSRCERINRRRFVASSALGGAAILTAGQLLPLGNRAGAPAVLAQDSSSDVPMFRGNAARTGEMPGPRPDDFNGVEIIWRFETGEEINSSPAVVDGAVYVGSGDYNLYAVNATDGMERWRFATSDAITSSPAVADGVVYIGSRDSNLYAVNALDGAERWRFAVGDSITSSPAVVDGLVYVGCQDGNLYAIGARVPKLSVGGTARVTETTSLRGGPAATAVERATLDTDTVVTITGEVEATGDVTWWPVTVDATGEQGWVEASKLEPLTSEPASTPQA